MIALQLCPPHISRSNIASWRGKPFAPFRRRDVKAIANLVHAVVYGKASIAFLVGVLHSRPSGENFLQLRSVNAEAGLKFPIL
jgi:hypothetical protein